MNSRRSGKISKFGAIALGGCAVLLLGLFLRGRGGEVPLSQLPPAEQERRRAEVEKLKEQAGDIAEKARRHESAHFQLTVTQEQVNTYIQEHPPDANAAVQNPRVVFTPGRVAVEGVAHYDGFSGTVQAGGAPSVENGQVKVNVDSVTVGVLPVPALKSKIEDELNRRLRAGLAETTLKIESVTVGDGTLTVSGNTG